MTSTTSSRHRLSTVEHYKIVDTAREVGREFARLGPDCEARNGLVPEVVDVFKSAGLVGLTVSKEYGGLGGDLWTLCAVSSELAKGDPACGLAFNMHFAMVGMLSQIMTSECKEAWLPQIAGDKKLVCGAYSEQRAGLNGLADTTATQVATGDFTVSGTKNWATLCQAADILTFNATITGDDGAVPDDALVHMAQERAMIIPMDTPGVSIKETWDAMGMRASGTHSVVFDSARVPESGVIGAYRHGLLTHFEWPALAFSAVYHGIARRAYEETREILRKKSLGATQLGADVRVRDVGYVQHALGRMLIQNETTARVMEATARQVADGRDAEWDPMSRPALLSVAKVVSTESAIEITGRAMQLVGGASFRRGHILERLYRDARSGSFHPLTSDQTADLLGKSELGLIDGGPGEPGDKMPTGE